MLKRKKTFKKKIKKKFRKTTKELVSKKSTNK